LSRKDTAPPKSNIEKQICVHVIGNDPAKRFAA